MAYDTTQFLNCRNTVKNSRDQVGRLHLPEQLVPGSGHLHLVRAQQRLVVVHGRRAEAHRPELKQLMVEISLLNQCSST